MSLPVVATGVGKSGPRGVPAAQHGPPRVAIQPSLLDRRPAAGRLPVCGEGTGGGVGSRVFCISSCHWCSALFTTGNASLRVTG